MAQGPSRCAETIKTNVFTAMNFAHKIIVVVLLHKRHIRVRTHFNLQTTFSYFVAILFLVKISLLLGQITTHKMTR